MAALLSSSIGTTSYPEVARLPTVRITPPQIDARGPPRSKSSSAVPAAVPQVIERATSAVRELFSWDRIADAHLTAYPRCARLRTMRRSHRCLCMRTAAGLGAGGSGGTGPWKRCTPGHEVWVITRSNNRGFDRVRARSERFPRLSTSSTSTLPRPFLRLKRRFGHIGMFGYAYYYLWQLWLAVRARRPPPSAPFRSCTSRDIRARHAFRVDWRGSASPFCLGTDRRQ